MTPADPVPDYLASPLGTAARCEWAWSPAVLATACVNPCSDLHGSVRKAPKDFKVVKVFKVVKTYHITRPPAAPAT